MTVPPFERSPTFLVFVYSTYPALNIVINISYELQYILLLKLSDIAKCLEFKGSEVSLLLLSILGYIPVYFL